MEQQKHFKMTSNSNAIKLTYNFVFSNLVLNLRLVCTGLLVAGTGSRGGTVGRRVVVGLLLVGLLVVGLLVVGLRVVVLLLLGLLEAGAGLGLLLLKSTSTSSLQ